MSRPSTLDARSRDLLCDAAEWRLLARLFECPDAGWRDELSRLAGELPATALQEAVSAVNELSTAGQYYSVFGPGGPAPPREASYHESVELGSLISELAGYYEAFGYAPVLTEPPDHVAVETGFVAYLTFKAAYAHAQGDEARADIATDAAAAFVTDHLSRIAQPLAKLLAASDLEYLARASQLLAARTGPGRGSRQLPMLSSASDDDEPEEFACGLP